MKIRTLFVLAAVALTAHAEPVPVGRGAVEVNGIAAKVNGRVITKNQVTFNLAPIYMQLSAQFPRRGPEFERQLKIARDKVLDEMIDREIILDEFKTMGATLKPQFVDEEIARQIRERFNGSREKLNAELKKSNLTPEAFREMTRERLVVQAMRAQKFSDAPPPLPNEIQKEYNEMKGSFRDITKDKLSFQMIYIPRLDPSNSLSTPDEQLALAERVMAELKDGKDFGELAKAHSKAADAATGGLRENWSRTDLSVPFAAILFEVQPGQVVGPLADEGGFSIVKVINKTPGPSEPLSNPKVRDLIEESVRRKKTAGAYDKWIASKRKKALIERKI